MICTYTRYYHSIYCLPKINVYIPRFQILQQRPTKKIGNPRNAIVRNNHVYFHCRSNC